MRIPHHLKLPNPVVAIMADYPEIIKAAKRKQEACERLPIEEKQAMALTTFEELRSEPSFRKEEPKIKVMVFRKCEKAFGEENAKNEFVNLFLDSIRDAGNMKINVGNIKKIREKAKVIIEFGRCSDKQHLRILYEKLKTKRKMRKRMKKVRP